MATPLESYFADMASSSMSFSSAALVVDNARLPQCPSREQPKGQSPPRVSRWDSNSSSDSMSCSGSNTSYSKSRWTSISYEKNPTAPSPVCRSSDDAAECKSDESDGARGLLVLPMSFRSLPYEQSKEDDSDLDLDLDLGLNLDDFRFGMKFHSNVGKPEGLPKIPMRTKKGFDAHIPLVGTRIA